MTSDSSPSTSLWITTVDMSTLHAYHERKLLKKSQHQSLPLSIWNYGFFNDKHWDHITTLCRGLIIENTTGRIVGRSFRKFWNDYDNRHTLTPTYHVFDKFDGSLGILFFYNNEWMITSRGSFHGDHAIQAKSMLNMYNLTYLNKNYSYALEIIFPTNRIVVNYGKRCELIFLAAFNLEDGNEIWPQPLEMISKCGFPVATSFPIDPTQTTLSDLKQLNTPNAEGFVIRFTNGTRCKIKFDTYLQLHRTIANITSSTIFNEFAANQDPNRRMAYLAALPDEFYQEVNEQWVAMESSYQTFHTEFLTVMSTFSEYKDNKSFAIAIKDHPWKRALFNVFLQKLGWQKNLHDFICGQIKSQFVGKEKKKDEKKDEKENDAEQVGQNNTSSSRSSSIPNHLETEQSDSIPSSPMMPSPSPVSNLDAEPSIAS